MNHLQKNELWTQLNREVVSHTNAVAYLSSIAPTRGLEGTEEKIATSTRAGVLNAWQQLESPSSVRHIREPLERYVTHTTLLQLRLYNAIKTCFMYLHEAPFNLAFHQEFTLESLRLLLSSIHEQRYENLSIGVQSPDQPKIATPAYLEQAVLSYSSLPKGVAIESFIATHEKTIQTIRNFLIELKAE